jgi:hypothetical protein
MKIFTNHIGYGCDSSKLAVVESSSAFTGKVSALLVASESEVPVARLEPQSYGPVEGWKGRFFYQFDFSDLNRPGSYMLEVTAGEETQRSYPFFIKDEILADRCISDILFYFKGQRSSGRWDVVDHSLPFFGERSGRVDLHGGWFDASGDYSKYLSHLSYANYLNPQQIPLVVWSLLSLGDALSAHAKYGGTLLTERAFEEGLFGADFLVRMQDPAGYFYTTVFDRWSKKNEERMVSAFKTKQGERLEGYQAAFRQGGGVAIAALAKASRYGRTEIPTDGFSPAVMLEKAIAGYEHLKTHNREYLDNGRENIIDFYCALLAAVELYHATGEDLYLHEARAWVDELLPLFSPEIDAWVVEKGNHRPFYHAAESGLPLIALVHYHKIEPDKEKKSRILSTILAVCEAEIARSQDVYNPFMLSRQMVQPVGGKVRASFFVAHENETGYWWQGENSRLASISAALRQAVVLLQAEKAGGNFNNDFIIGKMKKLADLQLDWILGLNPFDICMLHGHGRNNPEYEEHYPNAPGGICNGITGGYLDEMDVDFLPLAACNSGDHRWRWSEQWIPHAAWFLLALTSGLALEKISE